MEAHFLHPLGLLISFCHRAGPLATTGCCRAGGINPALSSLAAMQSRTPERQAPKIACGVSGRGLARRATNIDVGYSCHDPRVTAAGKIAERPGRGLNISGFVVNWLWSAQRSLKDPEFCSVTGAGGPARRWQLFKNRAAQYDEAVGPSGL